LALGADKATLIEIPAIDDSKSLELEPLAVAKLLKAFVKKSNANLVIMGKQAIDDDSNQTGQMLAGLLNWSQATNASKVTVDEASGVVTVSREVDGGTETLSAPLPLVITTDLRLNTPRYTKLQDIMKAKKKKTEKVSPEDLGVDISSRLEILSLSGIGFQCIVCPAQIVNNLIEPPKRTGGGKVDSVDALIGKLKESGAI
jgi:electron transfer flavoprotein beta subunit